MLPGCFPLAFPSTLAASSSREWKFFWDVATLIQKEVLFYRSIFQGEFYCHLVWNAVTGNQCRVLLCALKWDFGIFHVLELLALH